MSTSACDDPSHTAPISVTSLRRRRFLFALGATGAGAAATAAAPAVAAAAPATAAAPAGKGYQLTEHVRDYYDSTRL